MKETRLDVPGLAVKPSLLTADRAQFVQDLNQNNDGNDQQNGDNIEHARNMPKVASVRQDKSGLKAHRSIKAPGLKAAVIAKRVQGIPKRQIARETGIARMTVDSILNEADLDRQMSSGLILASELIPESIRVVKHRLAQNSESAAFGILNPLVLNRVSERPGAKMQGDIHLQQALSIIVKPAETQTVQVVDSKPDTQTT